MLHNGFYMTRLDRARITIWDTKFNQRVSMNYFNQSNDELIACTKHSKVLFVPSHTVFVQFHQSQRVCYDT
jgi:hypothetical protein